LKKPKLGIVGATGAVGQEILSLLSQRQFPFKQIKALASARSLGKELPFEDSVLTVEEARPEAFRDLDLAIFSAGGDTSRELGPQAVSRGCVVVDNSSAFRMDPTTPLVVPEINPDALDRHNGIVANPNCSTAVALMALCPLHERFGLRRFFCSTYQAVSGVGTTGLVELEEQVKAWAIGEAAMPEAFPHPIAFNLLPHVDAFRDDGYTKEELKMRNESRKILDIPDLAVSCTCVRVPVFRAHSIAINAEFTKPVNVPDAHAAIEQFSGVELRDDPGNKIYPMPIEYSGVEPCGVGRLRVDHAFDNGLALWVVGDQLWKGAALNAIQIAELLVEKDLV
jgi:aspartate-semialdehyde dehydrogenase|tara:strand:- start:331 stop:1344 length:1014 start_codon:yes stop_codon:yes gene_type:complete